jgi:DHA1 family quinolone resistance protein-like MFS transporter
MGHRTIEYIIVLLKGFLLFVTIYLPIYLKAIGLTGTEIGILMAVVAVSSFLFTFPIGVLNDRLTSRALIFISMWLVAAFYFGLTVFVGFWVLLVFFILSGFSTNLYNISVKSLFYKTLGNLHRGKLLGTFSFFESIGVVASYLIGGWLLGWLDFKLTFVILAITGFCFSFLSLKLPKTKAFNFYFNDYLKDLETGQAIITAIFLFLISTHWGPERVNMTIYIRDDVGLSFFSMGALLGVAMIFLAISVFYYGKKYDQGFSLKRILGYGLLFNAIGSIGWYFTTNPWLIFLLRSVHEFGDGAITAFIVIQTANLFSKKRIGGDSSAFIFITIIGTTAGALAGGVISDYYGNLLPIVLSGIVSILALSLVPLLKVKTVMAKPA